MSLTEGLAILAGVVLALLAGQGVWLSVRSRPRRAEGSTSERLEPRLEPGEPDRTAPSVGAQAEVERGATRVVAPRWRPPTLIDPLIDAVAELSIESPLPGEAALAALPPSRRAGSKPMCIEGLNAETGVWEQPTSGQRYGAFQAGVQLANRAGPLNEIEYSEFVQKVQAFADVIGSSADVTDMLEVVARARELDDFAHAHDAQLAVHVRARSMAWTVGYLTQVAARHGVVPAALPGLLVLPGAEPDAPPLVSIRFDARAALSDDPDETALREFTLTLDVPQSPQEAEPFAHWQRLAASLSSEMEGDLLDDDGRRVSIQQFAAIHHQLERLYSALASRDLPAGSVAARRLFS